MRLYAKETEKVQQKKEGQKVYPEADLEVRKLNGLGVS